MRPYPAARMARLIGAREKAGSRITALNLLNLDRLVIVALYERRRPKTPKP